MKKFYLIASIFGLVLTSCISETTNTEGISDTQKLVALKNVSYSYTSTEVTLSGIPTGLDSNKSFTELSGEGSAYNNPANYTLEFKMEFKGNNQGNQDASFEGMRVNMELDTISNEPINLETGAVSFPKNKETDFSLSTSINLQTHRKSGIYIMEQMVAGEDIDTKLTPTVFYKFGQLDGSLTPIPAWEQKIPTRASPETKAFLADLLDSGVLD